MDIIIGLLVAAFILVFFEVILPGGILGTFAALCVILASWFAGAEYGAGIGILTFVCSAADCLTRLDRVQTWRAPHSAAHFS